jgi:hypothetical protein
MNIKHRDDQVSILLRPWEWDAFRSLLLNAHTVEVPERFKDVLESMAAEVRSQ